VNSSLLEDVVAGRTPGVFALTVEQLRRMIETGILSEGTPVELIDGILVRKDRSEAGRGDTMVHGPRHAYAMTGFQRVASRIESAGLLARLQLPLTLSSSDEPEPDMAVVRGPREAFVARHPGPDDVVLVVEVADSSLAYDRTTKQRLYAQHGIPVYWIVNLPDRRFEVYDQPLVAEGRYLRRTEVLEGSSATFSTGDAVIDIAVSEVLPPR
jgi:hypothetical protein